MHSRTIASEPTVILAENVASAPLDWADALATKILIDALSGPSAQVRELIAARLRLLRHEGVIDGCEQARKAVLG